ncbi:MAG: NAD(P)H-hydrate epimerase [Tepidisphaeraceae bacterium]
MRAYFKPEAGSFDVTIDALFGTGLSRPIQGFTAEIVARMAAREPPFRGVIVSMDIPSGLDCDTGRPLGPCVRADRTITFATGKAGFAEPDAQNFTGQVVVADIGVPREVIKLAAASPP